MHGRTWCTGPATLEATFDPATGYPLQMNWDSVQKGATHGLALPLAFAPKDTVAAWTDCWTNHYYPLAPPGYTDEQVKLLCGAVQPAPVGAPTALRISATKDFNSIDLWFFLWMAELHRNSFLRAATQMTSCEHEVNSSNCAYLEWACVAVSMEKAPGHLSEKSREVTSGPV